MTLDAHVTGIWCGQIGGGGVGSISPHFGLALVPQLKFHLGIFPTVGLGALPKFKFCDFIGIKCNHYKIKPTPVLFGVVDFVKPRIIELKRKGTRQFLEDNRSENWSCLEPC